MSAEDVEAAMVNAIYAAFDDDPGCTPDDMAPIMLADLRAHGFYVHRSDPAKGGRTRAASLTPERRSEIARNAVNARWGKGNDEVAP